MSANRRGRITADLKGYGTPLSWCLWARSVSVAVVEAREAFDILQAVHGNI